MKLVIKKLFVMYVLIAFGTYTHYSLKNSAFTIEDTKQVLNNKCFGEQKELKAEITFKVNNDDMIFNIAFSLLDSMNDILKYVYTYNKKNPDILKIDLSFKGNSFFKQDNTEKSAPITVELSKEQEEKKIKDINFDFDKVLNSLNDITFCDISLKCLLNRDLKESITVRLDDISSNLSQDKDKIEKALQENIRQQNPDSLDKLSFLLYVTSLGLSKGQHEEIKTKSN